MNHEELKSSLATLNSQPEEFEREFSLEVLGIVQKTSKTGKEYPALHVRCFDHTYPHDGWKDKYFHARAKEAQLVVNRGPYISTERYKIKAQKNDKGFWTWQDITPATSSNT